MSGIEIVSLPPQHYVGLRRDVPVTELPAFFGEALPATFAWLGDKGIAPASPPIAVWRGMDKETGVADAHAGCFVAEPVDADGAMEAGATEGGEALKFVHVGPYSGMGKSWMGVYAHAEELGRKTGAGWEVYVDDPAKVPGEELRTEIYLPLLPE